MRDNRKIWLTIAVIGMVVVTGMAYTLLNPHNDGEYLSLTAKMSKNEYMSLESISVNLTLRNNGKQAVVLDDMDTKYANLELYLVLPNSTELKFHTPRAKCLPSEITLKPGEIITRNVMLNPDPRHFTGFSNDSAEFRYYGFSQPGEHTLYAVYDHYNGTEREYIRSNEVRFAILPDTGDGNLSLYLTTDKTEYGSAESISAYATLRNNGDEAVVVDNMSTIYTNLQFYLTLPNSTELQYWGGVVYCLPQKITLESGETIMQSIALNPTQSTGFKNTSAGITSYYDFSQKGEYTLYASYRFGNGNCSYEIRSNEVRFPIV